MKCQDGGAWPHHPVCRERLTVYFQNTKEIRLLIYTTNTVEGYHRQIRKVTENKGGFPSGTALEKLVFLAYRNISEQWTTSLVNFSYTLIRVSLNWGNVLIYTYCS